MNKKIANEFRVYYDNNGSYQDFSDIDSAYKYAKEEGGCVKQAYWTRDKDGKIVKTWRVA